MVIVSRCGGRWVYGSEEMEKLVFVSRGVHRACSEEATEKLVNVAVSRDGDLWL